mgnify:CR=1 FL=1
MADQSLGTFVKKMLVSVWYRLASYALLVHSVGMTKRILVTGAGGTLVGTSLKHCLIMDRMLSPLIFDSTMLTVVRNT